MLLRFVQSEQLKSLTDGQLLVRYLNHNDHGIAVKQDFCSRGTKSTVTKARVPIRPKEPSVNRQT